ncbi:ABC transporter permease [Leuconostoc gasicomitatum]|uniref:Transmembrane component YkoC of energizing module of thiamin-regulated ECF transporter for HydroxyMethylPyrimidine n=2 Tax=Leuconostoc TaxID=1243 RepID=A0AAN2UHG5_9LACO|nr:MULTISPECIES: energy-coupling factor transporter transmembrane component T [Leuconostoc]MBZ5946564.1 cobalt ABC transporter permease [Leuconostoc gasicomitatum]MBZ5947588.1 cobalt ABC transporter permease [Leuconostoc gasicomitatum]MBZ5957118.1 cobalt ABC transporter permease [Leuconostoc gasicomitatum]MBZ5958504.1 cobalt ABC transporter permease [Leuconostoc gasicomitatum]MBZ5960386.1 cobalt ABC transporter permease [Leuconostoc gasicomitatum]
MNPLIKFTTVMVIALELTFIKSVTLNVIVIGVSGFLYLFLKLHWRQWLWLFILPLLPGLGSWFSLMYFGTGDHEHMAWIMLSRVFAYLWLGGLFTLKLNDERDVFLATLEQKAKLSATFVYALVGVLNFMPAVSQEMKTIRVASQMRGQTLHIWQPQLYFKAILAAIRWSQNLAEGMVSHGFTEGAARTHLQVVTIKRRDWFLLIIILIAFQLLLLPNWY